MTTAPASLPRPSALLGDDFFEGFLASRSEPSWLTERRRAAFTAAKSLPWPTLRDEEWRRTDIRAFKPEAFVGVTPGTPSDTVRAEVEAAVNELRGHYGLGIARTNAGTPVRVGEADLGGAVFLDLETAVREHGDLLEKRLSTSIVDPAADVLSALHAAYWTTGVFLYVPKGVRVETPLFSLVASAGEGVLDLDHTIVIVEEEGEASLVRELRSFGREGRAGLHLGAVELAVADRAKLQFVDLQAWDDATWHFSRERAEISAGGSIQWTVGALGSRLSKVNQEVALTGERAQAQVNGVIFATGRRHLAYFTRQDHQAPHTTSDLLYKGGLNDASRVVWKGMIRVEKDAQRTDAYQKNDSLILSEAARADSIPGLEIEANDVRCTHGATAGPVDEEMVFYLQARGIDRETAVRLIVEGFFANVYDRISLEPVRETLRRAVAEKLELGGSSNSSPTSEA
ncbi:MAG: Fe-S cluster assembly protein SufD [Isosphaeraceae bacterium]|nr:Fe-S cluster assembly protein SufD [Isosphaeraceae bacterium]